jgi:serine/threonine-protein kinase CHEK2
VIPEILEAFMLMAFADVAPEILAQTRQRRYTRAVDVWSLGVVLYICLCGFPPFSDELYTRENPYTLAQQIKMGRFDYPSPYWDSVGDPALDLIDRMLTVDVDRRITVDECLNHPWVTGKLDTWQLNVSMTDSTDGLTGQLDKLDFSKRKIERERTLLSSINDVKVTKKIEIDQPDSGAPPTQVKVFDKNPGGKKNMAKPKPDQNNAVRKTEDDPAAHRATEEFMGMGGKGDMTLFGDDASSRYLPQEVPK